MVRILQYDPQISAEAYSRRRAVEQPFESPVAAGLGQLGRALMAKSDQAVRVRQRQSEAAAKSSEDQFVSELRTYEQRLLDGEAPDDETFSDEAIMARVSPEVADRLIRERDRAEARGNAFAEIQFMSEAEIKERLGDAGRDEVRHLLWARGHRLELMKQGPAAFALRDPVVGRAHERWLQARADGDAAAAGQAGLAYANAALALQRRMGLSASERGVLTADMAAELVRQSELPDGPDAAALGTMLRDQLGEHWRVALADLERAGLSEQVAIIAGLDSPGQQPAARQLAGLVGTRTSDLRESAGDAAAAIDHLLGITIGGAQKASGDHAIGADTAGESWFGAGPMRLPPKAGRQTGRSKGRSRICRRPIHRNRAGRRNCRSRPWRRAGVFTLRRLGPEARLCGASWNASPGITICRTMSKMP